MNQNRIVVVHPEGNAAQNPHLYALVNLLSDKGYRVEVLATRRSHQQHAWRSDLRLRIYPRGVLKILYFFAGIPGLSWVAAMAFRFRRASASCCLVIGVDAQGVVVGELMARTRRVPCIYLSYEILFVSEVGRRRKRREIAACRHIAGAIVQDPLRGELLARENGLDPGSLFYMPVAASGAGEPMSGSLRSSLGIGTGQKIAMFMGSLTRWSGFDEVLESLSDWPPDWCMVVHDRCGSLPGHLTHHSLLGQRLFLSREAVETNDDLGSLLGDVDLGLCLYHPDGREPTTGRNISAIGMASGKISTFLRYGVPILTNEIGMMAELVTSWDLGVVLRAGEDLPTKLRSVAAKRPADSKRCVQFFLDHLDLDDTCKRFMEYVDGVCPGS